MSELLEAVVIGAGSAGLGTSYFLRQKGVPHAVIERSRIGETWRTQRWDSFLLNSSNIRSMLPGDTYKGSDPWGAATQHELIAYMEDYARRNDLPVTEGNPVRRLAKEDGGFVLETESGPIRARNVIVATGNLNCPIRPSWSADLSPAIRQIDCVEYRNPAGLGRGTILVVGSGQSGGQIAEELVQAGRSVFLATSRTGRLVRSYRRGDTFEWLTISGFLDVPRKEILRASGKPPPRALHGATHTISLQSLSAQGAVLLGRFQGIQGKHLMFADDVVENIRFADEASANVKRFIDGYIERSGLDCPAAEEDPAETVQPSLPDPLIRSIDWAAHNLRSIIWCTGFVGDFRWIEIPGALDEGGQPVHEEGLTALPGLYFAGLDFASTRKSGIILGVAEHCERLVEHLVARQT